MKIPCVKNTVAENPIPNKYGNMIEPEDIKFEGLKNNKYTVSRIVFENKDILNFPWNYNILPGKIVEKFILDKIIIPEYIARPMHYLPV